MPEAPILGRLLILSTTSAAALPYLESARKLNVISVLGLEASAAPELPNQLAFFPDAIEQVLRLQLDTRDSALAIAQFAMQNPLIGILAADERSAPSAARSASMIGLPGHTPKAADVCLNKFGLMQELKNAGLPVPLLAGTNASSAAVIALLDDGKMRVLGIKNGRQDVLLPRTTLENLWRAARLLGLRQGPLYARVSLAGENQILDLSPAIPAAFLEAMRFRIPLVDDDISLAEILVRHALRLDLSRAHPLPARPLE